MGETRGLAVRAASELLYDVVGVGMWAYAHGAFRLEVLGAAELDRALAEAVEGARLEGRRADTALLSPGARRRRLSDCLSAVDRLGLVAAPNPRLHALDRERVLAEGPLLRAAREYASARTVPGPLSTREDLRRYPFLRVDNVQAKP